MRSLSSRRVSPPAKILLVDDNRDGVMARSSVLRELGYEVFPADCGPEALELAQRHSFDLLITDLRMSPMDGLELIRTLRNDQFTKPIILLTGFAENLGLKPENTGADVVLQKSANEILMLVRHTKRLLNLLRKPAGSCSGKIALRSTKKA